VNISISNFNLQLFLELILKLTSNQLSEKQKAKANFPQCSLAENDLSLVRGKFLRDTDTCNIGGQEIRPSNRISA